MLENPKLLLPTTHPHQALVPESLIATPRFQPKQVKHLDWSRNALEHARARQARVAIGADQLAAGGTQENSPWLRSLLDAAGDMQRYAVGFLPVG